MISEDPVEDAPAADNDARRADRALKHTRLIPAAAERVFQAFRDEALLALWFGPKDFRNRFEVFEFRAGGQWRLVMVGPDGTEYPNQWKFLAIDGERRVLLEHMGGMHHFVLDITLEPRGDATIVHWVQTFDTGKEKLDLAPFVEPANEQNLERLEAVVCGGGGKESG
jgi:uncharacterized protein YndB with AHSA1/START domain